MRVRSAECGVQRAECGVRSAEGRGRRAECRVRSAEGGVRRAEGRMAIRGEKHLTIEGFYGKIRV